MRITFTKIKNLYELFKSYIELLIRSKNKKIKKNAVIFYCPELSISTYTDLYKLIDRKLIEQNIPTYFI